MTLEILRLDGPTFDAAIPDLAMILADAVAGGASVGFTLPFTPDDAATWWQGIERDVVHGTVLVVVARLERRVVGTAQLRLAPLPNARHRAEVAKVLVHRSARRRGIATALMREIERIALGRRAHTLDARYDHRQRGGADVYKARLDARRRDPRIRRTPIGRASTDDDLLSETHEMKPSGGTTY
jgi:GNAT superfamily N-acetyltransferase